MTRTKTENSFKLIECPRDAMQGLHEFIPTELKAQYINALLQIGFDTLDFGSFVSPKAIPQMQDTPRVLSKLDLSKSKTKLLAIVANLRGVNNAVVYEQISYLGFPFSISETFQFRNANASVSQSLQTVEEMLNICDKNGKKAVIYLSMSFGNPYGDKWNMEIVQKWAEILFNKGVQILSLADTVGTSTPAQIKTILPLLSKAYREKEIGLHLHSTPAQRMEKIEAAYLAGCKRIDSALKGFGGCPMATDNLTGNIATEDVASYLHSKGIDLQLNLDKWQEAMTLANRIFLTPQI